MSAAEARIALGAATVVEAGGNPPSVSFRLGEAVFRLRMPGGTVAEQGQLVRRFAARLFETFELELVLADLPGEAIPVAPGRLRLGEVQLVEAGGRPPEMVLGSGPSGLLLRKTLTLAIPGVGSACVAQAQWLARRLYDLAALDVVLPEAP